MLIKRIWTDLKLKKGSDFLNSALLSTKQVLRNVCCSSLVLTCMLSIPCNFDWPACCPSIVISFDLHALNPFSKWTDLHAVHDSNEVDEYTQLIVWHPQKLVDRWSLEYCSFQKYVRRRTGTQVSRLKPVLKEVISVQRAICHNGQKVICRGHVETKK